MLIRRALVISAFTFAAFAANQIAGTWKLNVAKSKYTGIPTPKTSSVTYTPQGQGWKYDAKGTSADGQPTNITFVYDKDGAEAMMTGNPYADTITIQSGNTDNSTAIFKRAGKAIGTAKRTISKDGKTMTVDASITLPDGKKASYSAVYDKQ